MSLKLYTPTSRVFFTLHIKGTEARIEETFTLKELGFYDELIEKSTATQISAAIQGLFIEWRSQYLSSSWSIIQSEE